MRSDVHYHPHVVLYEQYRDPELVAKAPEETDRVLGLGGFIPAVGSSSNRSRGSEARAALSRRGAALHREASRELVAYPLRPTYSMSASARASARASST